ncbi:tripartite motif-containing protein 55-like isoform X1 [Ptychodera flava]|uniref:tripartite motif-containing protein 55-like isoform X1 n=1 Tax=Ptychodera flava TaxID=63121 RepID=UPI00396A9B48
MMAAANLNLKGRTTTEGLECELTCPICMEIFNQPLKLPCEHDLCRRCAENLLHSQAVIRGRRPRAFRCPECREKVEVDGRGIDSLRRNVRLQNIIDRFVAARKDNTHGYRMGKTVDVAVGGDGCVNSELLLDSSTETSNRDGQQMKSLQQEKETLITEIDELCIANNEMEDFIEEMDNLRSLIRDNARKCTQLVNSEIESLISTIKQRQNVLIEKITKQEREKLVLVNNQIKMGKRLLDEGLNTALHIEDIVENYDNDSLIQNLQTLKNRIVQVKRDVNSCLQEHMVEPELGFVVDFKLQKKVLEMLDIISSKPNIKLQIGELTSSVFAPAYIQVPQIPFVPLITVRNTTIPMATASFCPPGGVKSNSLPEFSSLVAAMTPTSADSSTISIPQVDANQLTSTESTSKSTTQLICRTPHLQMTGKPWTDNLLSPVKNPRTRPIFSLGDLTHNAAPLSVTMPTAQENSCRSEIPSRNEDLPSRGAIQSVKGTQNRGRRAKEMTNLIYDSKACNTDSACAMPLLVGAFSGPPTSVNNARHRVRPRTSPVHRNVDDRRQETFI